MIEKLWEILPLNNQNVDDLMHSCAIGKLPALVLSARGINIQKANELIHLDETILHDSYLLPQMKEAVSFLEQAIKLNKRICIFGDYDCDGITATVMVYDYLQSIGADVFFSLPKREKEGYGLTNSVIDDIKSKGAHVILTVDNGISSIEEIEYANSIGLQTIVTDHHTCGDVLPDAVAVVNPHRKDSKYPFPDLCGCGVAFKLISAMENDNGDSLIPLYGDILAIGTIADMVPIVDENRYFVNQGLEILRDTARPGLRALIEKSGIDIKNVKADSISFGLAPRINASGRMADAEIAAIMLMEEDESKAEEAAEKLCYYNTLRRTSEQEAASIINKIINDNKKYLADRVIIVAGTGWNQGVSGIVCSRLSEKFKKPCIVITIDGSVSRGSGRSIDGFSLIDAITACSSYLTKFGGHPMAAGITLDTDKIDDFRFAMQEYSAKNYWNMPIKKLVVDALVEPDLINNEQIKELSVLEPYGMGNDIPTFAIKDCKLENIISLSDGKHTKLRLTKDNDNFYVMCFSTNSDTFPYQKGDMIDIAFNVELQEYMGEVSPSLRIRGIRPSGSNSKMVFESALDYDRFLRGETVNNDIKPTREDAAIIYKSMLKSSLNGFEIMDLYRFLKLENTISYAKYHIALDALTELSIIDNRDGKLYLNPNPEKTDFEKAPLLKKFETA